jgi:hypothetical protein
MLVAYLRPIALEVREKFLLEILTVRLLGEQFADEDDEHVHIERLERLRRFARLVFGADLSQYALKC